MSEAIEITTFRLVSGLGTEDFVEANRDVDHWLQRQPGFLGRRICEREDGAIVDLVFWKSAADGHRSAAAIMTELATSPVHATIGQHTVDWTISDVHSATAARRAG